MQRYHKKVYFPDSAKNDLKNFTIKLNNKQWRYTKHCLQHVKWRSYNFENILKYIQQKKLNDMDIFEYSTLNNKIIKACYRFTYSEGMDIILVTDENKSIVTIYLNMSADKHNTLKTCQYNKS